MLRGDEHAITKVNPMQNSRIPRCKRLRLVAWRWPEIMKEAQAAEFLQVSVFTLQGWRSKGVGPMWSNVGGVRYRKGDLEAYVASQLRPTTEQQPVGHQLPKDQ